MGRFDNLLRRFQAGSQTFSLYGLNKAKDTSQAPHIAAMARGAMPYIDERRTWENQADAYRQSSWWFKAVTTMARAAALVPLQVYKVTGDGERETIDNHPLELLLRQPNPHYSRFEFMEATFSALGISGNAFWYVRPNLAGTAGELWPLRPDRMTIVPHKTEYISGYVYEVQGERVPFEREEVLHFRYYNPLDDYVGLSAAQPLAYALGNDTAALEWNYSFFDNNARPDMFLSTDEALNPIDAERLQKEWNKQYRGRGKAHKTAFMTHGFKPIIMGSSQKDMDWVEMRKLMREEIWQIMSMPMGMWSENATEANATVALQVFYNFGLWPLLVSVADKITAALLPRYGDELVAEYEDVRITDRQLQLEEENTYRLTHTINETRAEFHNDEPLDGGDVLLTPQGDVIPGIGEAEEKKPPPPQLMPFAQPAEPNEDEEAEAIAEEAEVAKWQKWALARFKRKEWPPDRPFAAKCVDPIRKAYIEAALEDAKTAQEVKAAFVAPFCGYP